MYSVELSTGEGGAEEERPKEDEVYEQQYEERKKLRRRKKLNLTGSYHACNDDCCHGLPPSPPKAPVTSKPKSWFQKYAELGLVEIGAGTPEVNAVPKVSNDVN